MRKIVAVLLLAAFVSLLSACGNRDMSREMAANIQQKKDQKAIEDTRMALTNPEADSENAENTLSTSGAENKDPENTLSNPEADSEDSEDKLPTQQQNETHELGSNDDRDSSDDRESSDEQGSNNEQGRSPYNGKYDEVTFSTYVNQLQDEEQTGDYYKMPGQVQEFMTFDNGIEYMVLGVEFGFIAIAKMSVVDDWDKIKVGDAITVYFRHIGFLPYEEYLHKYSEMPIGSYEYFEYYK